MRKIITAALLAAFFTACRGSDVRGTAELSGAELAAAVPRPEFTLTATDGQPFSFAERTAGKLTLLFFGFTNCPDICPVHASNIAAVVKTLPWADRQRVQFVFVSTDPDRDSLPAIRAWLDKFDSTFIGLRGPLDQVNAIQHGLNLGTLPPGEKREDGSYDVQHAAVVLAIEPDDSLRVIYPFGVRQEDWAKDIPVLLTRHSTN